MSFTVAGDYFEACTCKVSCPCIFVAPATEDRCDLLVAWHVDKGNKDGVVLDGFNVVLALHSPKQMTDGGWKVALYLDDRADEAQASALGAVFSGQAGGHLANLGPLIGEVVGVRPASITYERDGGTRRLTLDDIGVMECAEVVGMDGSSAPVITNPLFGVITQPITQAKAVDVRFEDEVFTLNTSGTTSFIAEFSYAS